MNAMEIIAAVQGGVLSVAFLFIAFNLPKMIREHQTGKAKERQEEYAEDAKIREYQSQERAADRLARHEMAAITSKSIAELTVAIYEMKGLHEKMCKYQPRP